MEKGCCGLKNPKVRWKRTGSEKKYGLLFFLRLKNGGPAITSNEPVTFNPHPSLITNPFRFKYNAPGFISPCVCIYLAGWGSFMPFPPWFFFLISFMSCLFASCVLCLVSCGLSLCVFVSLFHYV